MKIEKQRILLVGLYKDTNLGDRVIFDCTKALLQKNGEVEIFPLYLAPKMLLIERAIRKVYSLFAGEKKASKLYSYFYYRHFVSAVKNCDKIVFCGGGIIKWRYQFFGNQIAGICKAAEKYGKNVYFNASGVEGYSENDYRCQVLKKAVNSNCVRYISTRDDIECLNNNYVFNSSIKTKLVADPAVFAAKFYEFSKKESDVIGIGLIRKNIFIDNCVDYSGKELCSFYIALINKIQEEGLKVQLFTNGFAKDLELAEEICEGCNIDSGSIISPKSAIELVQTISSFACVVAGRLHACIIAYSLDIPAIGLCWNDKLKLFGENIGYPQRFIEPENMNEDYALEELKEAIKNNYDKKNKEKFLQTQIQSIKDIFDDKFDNKSLIGGGYGSIVKYCNTTLNNIWRYVA